MNRLFPALLVAALLAASACNSEPKASDTSTTGSMTPESTATDSASMAAPADTAGGSAAPAPRP